MSENNKISNIPPQATVSPNPKENQYTSLLTINIKTLESGGHMILLHSKSTPLAWKSTLVATEFLS